MKQVLLNFLKHRELLNYLVERDIKVKYKRSILGVVWTVLNPLLMMVVLTIVFSNVFRQDIENFPVYLLCGQIIFNFFSEATTVAMSSVIGNATLIKKVYIPKYIFPLSKVLSSMVTLLASCIALIIVMMATGTPVRPTFFMVVFPILYLFMFSLGVGLILAAVAVDFRDILHLYSVLITAWTYLTPIFYPITILPDWIAKLVYMNPLTTILQLFRDAVLYGTISSIRMHLICVGTSLFVLLLGGFIFKKKQAGFILKI